MTRLPLCIRSFSKVNLVLAILSRRTDGFHEIRTVLQSIDLCDELEFRPSKLIELECENLPGVPIEENLVWRAAAALAAAVSEKRGVSIILRKKIPVGSGLGGGSSNAAATLVGLCRFWGINMPESELASLAAGLGSDVPFFLKGGSALGVGRGEEIYELPDIPPAHLVVIFPGVHIPTGEAYRSLSLGLTSARATHRIQRFCGQLQKGICCLAEIFNDFETTILPAHPLIREARDFLKERGAIASLLAGSGSSVFGFFLDEESAFAAARAAARETWRVFPAKTLSRADYFQQMFG